MIIILDDLIHDYIVIHHYVMILDDLEYLLWQDF